MQLFRDLWSGRQQNDQKAENLECLDGVSGLEEVTNRYGFVGTVLFSTTRQWRGVCRICHFCLSDSVKGNSFARNQFLLIYGNAKVTRNSAPSRKPLWSFELWTVRTNGKSLVSYLYIKETCSDTSSPFCHRSPLFCYGFSCFKEWIEVFTNAMLIPPPDVANERPSSKDCKSCWNQSQKWEYWPK